MVKVLPNMHFNSNLETPCVESSVSILNPMAYVFTLEVNTFKMIIEPSSSTRSSGYAVPIIFTNCNAREVIPQIRDYITNSCIVNHQPIYFVHQFSVCDSYANSVEKLNDLSSVVYLSPKDLNSPLNHTSTGYKDAPLIDHYLSDMSSTFGKHGALVNKNINENILSLNIYVAIMVTILILSCFIINEFNIHNEACWGGGGGGGVRRLMKEPAMNHIHRQPSWIQVIHNLGI